MVPREREGGLGYRNEGGIEGLGQRNRRNKEQVKERVKKWVAVGGSPGTSQTSPSPRGYNVNAQIHIHHWVNNDPSIVA